MCEPTHQEPPQQTRIAMATFISIAMRAMTNYDDEDIRTFLRAAWDNLNEHLQEDEDNEPRHVSFDI
jgi:hypothetical protein